MVIKILRAFGIAFLIAGCAIVGIVTPVNAVNTPGPLPSRESLYFAPWGLENQAGPQLFQVDPSGATVAVSTSGVTTDSEYGFFWSGASFDPLSGKYYLIDQNKKTMWQVNPSTGIFSNPLVLSYADDDPTGYMFYPYSLAIASDGTAYVSDGGQKLFRVNRTTGDVTYLGNLNRPIVNLAFNYAEGKLYTFASGTYLTEIIPQSASFTYEEELVNYLPVGSGDANSIQFSSDGTLWILDNNKKVCSADISSPLAPAVCSERFSGAYTDDNQPYTLLLTTVVEQTVTFDPNGGTGTMATQSASAQSPLRSNEYTRAGYSFIGWSTSPNGPVEFANEAPYAFAASITLYAQWQAQALADTGVETIQWEIVGLALSVLGGSVLLINSRRKMG